MAEALQPHSAMTLVHIATRKARGAARSLRATANRFRFQQAVGRLPPFPVPRESDRVIHLLAGHTRVPGTIATLASALRFFERHERPSVRLFDDGTLTAADVQELRAHVPGIDLI